MAHRGTLFLDKIGEIPLNIQPRLLRVQQERVVRRLGGDKVIPIDVRIIKDPEKHEAARGAKLKEKQY